ncbi:MAG: hypothetical protein U0X91_06010 [Spirosomataceae bacterium]
MLFSFDIRGNLLPAQKLIVPFDTFKETFVYSFDPDSTRYAIFEQYCRFLNDFSELVSHRFTHWINGSFVSNQVNPEDIDFVTLIDFETYYVHQTLIEQRFRLQGARNIYGVDAYTIRVYPETHLKYVHTSMDFAYWNNWFGKTKANRAGKKFDKGFVELNYS